MTNCYLYVASVQRYPSHWTLKYFFLHRALSDFVERINANSKQIPHKPICSQREMIQLMARVVTKGDHITVQRAKGRELEKPLLDLKYTLKSKKYCFSQMC